VVVDAAPIHDVAGLDQVRGALERLYDAGDRGLLLDTVVSLLTKVNADNEQKAIRIRQLLQQLYGRKSEKLSPNQLRLALAELAKQAVGETAAPAPSGDEPANQDEAARPTERDRPRRKHPGRNPLPASLPRRERRHTVVDEDKICEGCGKPKRHIRDELTEGLNWIPGHFEVQADVQEVWACACGDGTVSTAPAPTRHVCGGLARCGLLAQVLIQKYRDHLPLHRQAKIFRRAGVEVSANTMGDWIKAAATALGPLYALIGAQVMKSHVVQADDTGILVLGDPDSSGKGRRKRKKPTKKGHIWTFVGDGRCVVYAYTPTWQKEGPAELLAEREGWLQVDGYGGFDHIFARGAPKVIEVGCMMHARRYWVKALDAGDLRAAEPLEIIRRLYKIEADAKQAGDDHAARLARRQRDSAPLMAALEAWILALKPNEPPKTPMGRALTYASNQWQALNRFLEDGALEIDNGGAERALRGTAIGRRNWLFAGSDDGARRTTIICTLIESAVMHGLEPWLYLSDVLQKLDDGWPQARVDELLPHRWAELHQSAAEAGRPRPAAAE